MAEITGTVSRLGKFGNSFALKGVEGWFNFNKSWDGPMPGEGQPVEVEFTQAGEDQNGNPKRWVNAWNMAEGVPVAVATSNGNGRAPTPGNGTAWGDTLTLKDRAIIRQSCLKAASEFCMSRLDLKSKDMLEVAKRCEAWVLEVYKTPKQPGERGYEDVFGGEDDESVAF